MNATAGCLDLETDETITVYTSLPPKVDGQLRCYLKLKVSQITWLIPNSPDITQVRVQWWGEDGPGTLFRPADGKKLNRSLRQTTARYGIRSGPKQFAAYLSDMGSLLLEVLSGVNQLLVGRAHITNISSLSPSHSISGQFPVFSADSEKVAELNVMLALESIMASFDNSATTPTTDMNVDGHSSDPPPLNMPRVIPAPRILASTNVIPSKPPSGRSTPMGVDAKLYAAELPLRTAPSSSEINHNNGIAVTKAVVPALKSTGLDSVEQSTSNVHTADNRQRLPPGATTVGLEGGQQKDLLTTLLVRGNKLRDAMIVSSLEVKSANSAASESKNRPLTSANLPFESDLSVDGVPYDVNLSDQELQVAYDNIEMGTSADDDDFFSDIDGSIQGISLKHRLLNMTDSDDLSDTDVDLNSVLQQSSSRRSQQRSRSQSSNNSLNEPGNQRPPSRHSSLSDNDLTLSVNDVKSKTTRKSASGLKPPAVDCKKLTNGGRHQPRKRERRAGRTKARKRSRSLVSESDSDANGSCHSDGSVSRVSFDPTPSDSEVNDSVGQKKTSQVDGLSVHRLTLLGRVHIARVVMESLLLEDGDIDLTPTRERRSGAVVRGKPPTPTLPKKVKKTFFVEYQFPVVATSRDKHEPNAMATEVMRVVSTKVAGNLVTFGHRSVFPVMFDADSLEKWWKSALVFKVYSKSPSQKLPKLVGMSSLPLKSVLKADALILDKILDIKDRSNGSSSSITPRTEQDVDWPVVGQLKVFVELASDSKDFASALAKTQLAELKNAKIVPIPQQKPKIALPPDHRQVVVGDDGRVSDSVKSSFGTQTEPVATNINRMPLDVPRQSRVLYKDSEQTFNDEIQVASSESTKGISGITPTAPPKPTMGWNGRDVATRNLYVVSRMFWSDDLCRSDVCWGTFNPQFNFTQVAPVLLTRSLLERMRDNFMVIEVWDKKTSAHDDQLVGIVKVSLHQFYMSYRDRKVSAALLKSQYPVIACDSSLPIINPLSGFQYGHVKVLLSLGSMDQISSMRKMMSNGTSAPERPVNYLERFHMNADGQSSSANQSIGDNIVDHVFEVIIEGINGLQLLDNMMWGEADCFVQYHFPAQSTAQSTSVTIGNSYGMSSLKAFRTATTLCVPDLVFNDISKHKIVLPEGTPVQRELLTACAGVGGGAGGIPFEVWCRYYYPNVRDQVIAKSVLPLAKLCAMVTMKKPNEASIQSFSLPLTSFASVDDSKDKVDETNSDKLNLPINGSLAVTINYRTNVSKGNHSASTTDPLMRRLPDAVICISVSVLKASGLQTAARELSQHDSSMQYASEVGVNSYVRVKLSFLKNEDERVTRTVARAFAPEFSSQMDFPCPLLWTEIGSDALSLAEILESADAKFEIWHQVPGRGFEVSKQQHQRTSGGSEDVSGRSLVAMSGDVLLGTVTIPLLQVITRSTGISGWYPINLLTVSWDTNSKNSSELSTQRLHRVVGGLELSVKFSHSDDRERVVHAARGVGWSPSYDIEHRDWTDADIMVDSHCEVNVAIDTVSFPLQNALFAGQTNLDPAASCYVRYKFYDRAAVCSKLSSLEEHDQYIVSSIKHSKSFLVNRSSPFYWYLNEERFEIQLWVTYQPQSIGTRPTTRDKLIGCAYLDLESLSDMRRRHHRISNVFPLFKPGVSSLGGACLAAHVSLQPCSSAADESLSEDDTQVSSHRRGKHDESSKKSQQTNATPSTAGKVVDFDKTFSVHIGIERAFHLPMTLDDRQGVKPSCYVSYQTADSPDTTYTDIVSDTNDPVWCHENNCRLSKDLLTTDNSKFVFRVWHKPRGLPQVPDKAADKAIGFVSVDLMPLIKGFPHISGFYNIIDFNGLCQGQIKVSIVPTELITDAAQTKSAIEPKVLGTSSVFLPTYTHWMPSENPILHSFSTALPHFNQHLENIRRHHIELQQQQLQQLNSDDPNAASRTILFQTLRTNLKELDEITTRLNRRLHSDQDKDEHPQDSEGPMPLSTSSALITYGSTSFDGTWGFHSTARSDKNNAADDAQLMPDAMASTTEAVAEMMRCTLEYTGSSVGRDQQWNSRLQQCDEVSSDERSESVLQRNAQKITVGQQIKDAERPAASSDLGHYEDSLKHAQKLLEQLNVINSNHVGVPGQRPDVSLDGDQVDSLIYNEDDEAEEEDTFSNIWATRQSRVHDNDSASDVSLDSTVGAAVDDSSFVLPRTLNDVPSANDENNVRLVNDGDRGGVTDSGDTWFIDMRDVRNRGVSNTNNNNGGSPRHTPHEMRTVGKTDRNLKSVDCELPRDDKDVSSLPNTIHEAPNAMSPSSSQHKVNTARRSAMHRRQSRRQPVNSSSSASDDEVYSNSTAASVEKTLHRHSRNDGATYGEVQSSTLPVTDDVSSRYVHSSPTVVDVEESADVVDVVRSVHPSGVASQVDRVPGHTAVRHDSSETAVSENYGVQMPLTKPPSSRHVAKYECVTRFMLNMQPISPSMRFSKLTVPNFFMPPSDLKQTMETVYGDSGRDRTGRISRAVDPDVESGKASAAQELVSKLSSFKTRPLGDQKTLQHNAEEARRIAKIFAQKFST